MRMFQIIVNQVKGDFLFQVICKEEGNLWVGILVLLVPWSWVSAEVRSTSYSQVFLEVSVGASVRCPFCVT